MKKILLFSASLLIVSSLGMTNVNASHRVRHTHHVHTVRMIHNKRSRKFYVNRIRLISIQLGSSNESMVRLNNGLHKMSKKKLIRLYNYLQKAYVKINHHKDIAL